MKKIDRTGEVSHNVDGLEMKIIEYKNNKEVKVLFTASGQIRNTNYLKFKEGKVYPTWRNKGNIDVCDAKANVVVKDNYDQMRHIGMGLAVALALGLGIVGIGTICGIIYGLVELLKFIC